MRGFRIVKGDLLLVVPAQSPIDGAVMLAKWPGHCAVRKIKLTGDQLMLLSYDHDLEAEPVSLSSISFVGRCVRLEASL